MSEIIKDIHGNKQLDCVSLSNEVLQKPESPIGQAKVEAVFNLIASRYRDVYNTYEQIRNSQPNKDTKSKLEALLHWGIITMPNPLVICAKMTLKGLHFLSESIKEDIWEKHDGDSQELWQNLQNKLNHLRVSHQINSVDDQV